jgi:NAD dependent epimerase/dehydratase family enzyme
LGTLYLGSIYLNEDKECGENFLQSVSSCWESLTFELQTSNT